MKSIRTVAALAAAVMLAGCLPVTTKTPVGTTAGFKNDAALYGTWKGQDSNGRDQRNAFLHFLKGRDGAMTAALILAAGNNDDEWEIYNLHLTRLGANTYMNAVMAISNATPPDDKLKNANIPLLYTIKGKTLTLYLLDEDKAKASITAGTIKGTIAPGTSGDVIITADAKDLDAFMARPEAAKLFKVLLVLKNLE
jgi:hypothetical protein